MCNIEETGKAEEREQTLVNLLTTYSTNIIDKFNHLKCNKCNQFHYHNTQCEDSICISKFMRNSLDEIIDMIDLFINIKFNIKTMVTNEEVVWIMTSYILTPKNYSYSGVIYWEETNKNKISFITHI